MGLIAVAPGGRRDMSKACLTSVTRAVLTVVSFWLAHRAYENSLRPQEFWWWWPAQALTACALFVWATCTRQYVAESVTRRMLRTTGAGAFLVTSLLAIRFGQQVGREMAALASACLACVAFVLWRSLPWESAELQGITGPRPQDRGVWFSSRARISCLLFALVSSLVAAVSAWQNRNEASLVFWLASCLVLWAGSPNRRGPSSAQPPFWPDHWDSPVPRATGLALLAPLVALALGLRVLLLESIPGGITIDESLHGETAQRLWAEGFPHFFSHTRWNGFPTLSFIILYFPMQLLGPAHEHLRLASGILGVLSILVTFFWVRRWWGPTTALLAAFFLAVHREHLYWSRLGTNNIQSVLVGTLLLAALARALQERTPRDWVFLGFAAASCWYTYHAAKLFPAIAAVILLVFQVGLPSERKLSANELLLAVFSFAIALAPLAATIVRDWAFFYHHTAHRTDVSYLLAALQAGDSEAVRAYLYQHVAGCLLLFWNSPRWGSFAEGKELSLLCLCGFGVMIWRLGKPRELAVVTWFFVVVILGGMTTYNPPWRPRMHGVLPIVALAAAIGIDRLRTLFYALFPRRVANAVFLGFTALVTSLAFYHNWWLEFIYWPSLHRTQFVGTVCQALRRSPLPLTAYMLGTGDGMPLTVAAAGCFLPKHPQRQLLDLALDAQVLPLPPEHRGHALIIIGPDQFSLLPAVEHYYPTAWKESVLHPQGAELLRMYRLSPHDWQNDRGLQISTLAGNHAPTVGYGTLELPWQADSTGTVPFHAYGLLWAERTGSYGVRSPQGQVSLNGRPTHPDDLTHLARGWHAVAVTGEFDGRAPALLLEWRRPMLQAWEAVPREYLNPHPEVHGLHARHCNEELAASSAVPLCEHPVEETIEPALSFDWRDEHYDPLPLLAMPGSGQEWVGWLDVEEGPNAVLRLETTTPTEVYVGDRLVLAVPGSVEASVTDALVSTAERSMPILVRSRCPGNRPCRFRTLRLSWRSPGGGWSAFARYRPALSAPVSPAGFPENELPTSPTPHESSTSSGGLR